ncbi:MAG TPA: DUF333 domain-containing protein [Anaerolineales bacterium]|nr:DUF333 domain-containing protein [Anaerolineales bacterium]
MENRQRNWLLLSAVASFVAGVFLVWKDSGAGWFLILLGIIDLGASARAGRASMEPNPRALRWGLIGVTLMLVLLAGVVGLLAARRAGSQAAAAPTQAGLPNPASVFCEEQGGRLEIRTDASGGQAGFCLLTDGSECEEWAYFRGECSPGGTAMLPSPTSSDLMVMPTVAPPEGWESYTHPSLGYTFFYPADCTFESTDPASYTLVVGPLENDEHWPWFNIAHPDVADYHPPTGIDLQAWLDEQSRLPGKVVGTRTIAGVTAVHTRFDDPRGPQPHSYSDDRFYFVHNGQLFELTILHTGKEDWAVYDRFLDSFHF